ncbi:MAG: hypothetical protein JST04_08390 [Bdellovibrionales bacterium]|nr:hypothetical protein [Bdellovibrionales bacterium]
MRLRRRTRTAIGFVLLTVSLTGGASIGYSKRGWDSGSVRTCWTSDLRRFSKEVSSVYLYATRAGLPTAEQSEEIRKWVDAAYNRSRVGVEMTGFSVCDENSPVDALLVYDADLSATDPDPKAVGKSRGVASPGDFSVSGSWMNRLTSIATQKKIESGLGLNWSGTTADIREIQSQMKKALTYRLPPGKRNRKDLVEIYAAFANGVEDDIRHWTVLHEFGHLSGLLHEERRKETANEQPGFCGAGAGDRMLEGTAANTESTFGTAFDPFSVMNYCRKNMQILYHKAVLVCAIGEDLRDGFSYLGENPASLDPLLKECDFIRQTPFPVDLTPRDVAGLRNLYLGETPTGVARDFRESDVEKKWLEIFLWTDRLHF